MIHVAPCSCELHVRIRDLESSLRVAEDNEEERAAQVYELDDKIRELEVSLSAEKASGKRRDESLNRMADEWATKARELRARAEKAEARVAELEHAATAMCKMCGKRGIGWWDGNVPGPRCWDHAPTRTEVETQSWHPWKVEPVGDETPSQGVQEREAD